MGSEGNDGKGIKCLANGILSGIFSKSPLLIIVINTSGVIQAAILLIILLGYCGITECNLDSNATCAYISI